MLHEVEDVEAVLEEPAVEAEGEGVFDPCPFCGEPAQHLGECFVCSMAGCLPPDLWSPGMLDPCLTLCVRCARSLHLACASEDEAGNPRCPTCLF